VVSNGEMEATRNWAGESQACFPVLVQQQYSVSKRYEMFATPFAFLIDERGVISSKGLINIGQHIGFVLAGEAAKNGQPEVEPAEEAGVS
jgi:hypothetical protein